MNIDKDGLPSNFITFSAQGYCDGKSLTLSLEDPAIQFNYLQAMAEAFSGLQHPVVELAARQYLPESGEKYRAMHDLFGQAIEDRLRRDPYDHKAPQMEYYQQKQRKEQERCEEQFEEHIRQIRNFPREAATFEEFVGHFYQARSLHPQSFKPYRALLLPLSAFCHIEQLHSFIEDFFKDAFAKFPLETYYCLITLLEYLAAACKDERNLSSLNYIYSFLCSCVPNDWLTLEFAAHVRRHYSMEVDTSEDAAEKKALYCRHFETGLNHWFKGQAEEAKEEWLRAKGFFFGNEEIYLLLALYHAKNEDGVKSLQLLLKSALAKKMGNAEGRAAYFLERNLNFPYPACTLLQGYLDFERHGRDISKYLERLFLDFESFFGTEDLMELLVLRFILQELSSDKLLPFYTQKQREQCAGIVYSLINSLYYQLKELAPSFCDRFLVVNEENTGHMAIPLSFPQEEAVWKINPVSLELDKESFVSLLKKLFLEGMNGIGRINLYLQPALSKEISELYSKGREGYLPNFDMVSSLLILFKNKRAWGDCFHLMRGVLTKEFAPVLASFLYAFVIEQFNESTSPDLLSQAADLFEKLEPLMPQEDLRFRDYKNFILQLAGKQDREANLDSWAGILTALLRGESPKVDLFALWSESQSYEEIPFVLSVCLLLHEPENALEWVTGHSEQIKPLYSGTQLKKPGKPLLEEMIKLGRDLQARNYVPEAYLFPNPKSSYQEIGAAAQVLFGQRARQTTDLLWQMLEARDCQNVFNPNTGVDFSLNQKPPGQGPLWFFNHSAPMGDSHTLFTALCHHELSILQGRMEHQKDIDGEKPKYTDSQPFMDWVRQDKRVQEAILKGKELPEMAQFGKSTMAQFQEDMKHKRAHHQKIIEIRKNGELFLKTHANHPFKWHFLVASLIQSVHEKGGTEEYNLYVPRIEDAYFIHQLVYEYSRKALRLHLLKDQRNASLDRERLPELLKEEGEKLVSAFHGPEIHYFGQGPRYPHFNSGVFHNGSLVNTHIFFGEFR